MNHIEEIDITETSGRVTSQETLIVSHNERFEGFEEIYASGYNRLIRAQRYGKFFALKALATKHKDDPYYQELMRKEFDLTIGLDHPNIVRAYSLETVEPYGLCIVMAYIDGRPLDKYLEEKPSMASRRQVVCQLIDALAYCHSQQIVHRDIKPANVMVTNNGNNVRLIDFGLSDADYYAILKEPAFSRRYASPEQLREEPLDCRTDIYSLGLLMRELFPHRYRRVARRCCQPQRELRYPSATEVAKTMFSTWRRLAWVLAIVALAAGMAWGYYAYRHVNVEEFCTLAPSGQALRCSIVDSEVHVLGGQHPKGDLEIPADIRYGLVRFPVVAIDKNAFIAELGITHLTLPEGLRVIDTSAFYECSSLTDTLVLPISLRRIGSAAFCATSLTHVVIRSKCLEAVPHVDNGIFFSCNKLQQLVIDSTADWIGESVLSACNIPSIVAPKHWTEIPPIAFSAVYDLRDLQLPERIKIIGNSAFYGVRATRLVMPDSVEQVGAYSFRWARCRYLEFGSQVKQIGSCALANMPWLDTLVIRAEEPPRCSLDIYDGEPPMGAVLLVPAASVERYKADTTFAPFRIKPL